MKNKKRKQKDTEEYVQLSNGIQLVFSDDSHDKLWVTLLAKGIIVFLLTFGTIGGFLSTIRMEYNEMLFLAAVLAASICVSMIYYNHYVRDLGYVVLFGIFLVAALKYRIYINSGFYAIINEFTEIIVDYYELSGANEYSEFISNRYTTVTAAACFIGIVEALLLNINVQTKMKALRCVLLSAALYFLPVYLNQEPDMLFVFCTIVGLGGVLLGRTGGHYKKTLSGKKKHKAKRSKRQKYISYDQSAKISIQTMMLAGIMGVMCIWAVGVVVPKAGFERTKSESGFKTMVDAAILDIWQYGMDGLFGNQTAAGGMSKGKLGRNTSVQPDYSTDLILTFTPYSTDTIYLKAYTGVVYGDSQWENDISLFPIPENTQPWEEKFKREAMFAEAFELQEQYENSESERSAQGIMKVENVDADADFLYYPYYTMFENYEDYQGVAGDGLAIGEERIYTYYPATWKDNSRQPAHTVDDIYMDVPEKNQDAVAAFCDEMNLSGTNQQKIEQVIQYFQDNIPYTVRPGAVPKDEDTINYFLSKNRKGYCAHFASAAVLIFRHLGIPARYVEGYAVSYSQVLEGEILSENYSDYYDGYSELGETAVVQVEVSDASAHAWVEVYDQKYGWICVDVTPSSGEEENAGTDFWNFFGSLFSGGTDTEQIQSEEEDHGGVISVNFGRSAYVLGGMILLLLLICIVRVRKKLRLCNVGEEKEQVIGEYHLLCQTIRAIRGEFNNCFSHKEQLEWMEKQFEVKVEDLEKTAEVLACISYSEKEAAGEVLIQQKNKLRQMRKQIVHGCTIKEKRKILMYWIGKAC